MTLDDVVEVVLQDVQASREAHVLLRDLLVKLTLEQVVEKERPSQPVRAQTVDEHAREPALGDQAESYTLNLPHYEELTSSYMFNYVSDAVKANDNATTAAYNDIDAGKADIYEAAVASIENARASKVDGDIYGSYRQSIEVQERTETFKRLYPEKWKMLYDCPWLKSTMHAA